MAKAGTATFEHRSTQQTSTQTQRNGEPSRVTLAAFACNPAKGATGKPARTGRAGPPWRALAGGGAARESYY